MEGKRIVAALTGDGRIIPVEQEIPATRPGSVLLAAHSSLVSPGTELGSWRALARQKQEPKPLPQPRPFGYSNAGVVVETGAGVEEFKEGDRIACIGGGYAMHSNFAVVPHHLCVRLPDQVTFDQGAYAMLAATALHTLRRGEPGFGEYCAVIGLGLVGQLTARFYQLAGNYVIGWDMIRPRCEIARRWGIDGTAVIGAEDEVLATQGFTRGCGLDCAVLAFGGDANQAMEGLKKCLKLSPDGHRMGRIVIVGAPRFNFDGGVSNFDIVRAARTGAGYHDEAWEYGPDYPPVFMRWTTRTNLELCMRLIAEAKLDVDALTTHRIPLEDVEAGIERILGDPDGILGVIFQMNRSPSCQGGK
jgi:threonine dehydrogenase-like Zn-dependent dehydrogenase